MARMFDDMMVILNEGTLSHSDVYAKINFPDEELKNRLLSVPVFVIDEIFAACWQRDQSGEKLDNRSLPRWSPPFEDFWMEARFPEKLIDADAHAIGVLFQGIDWYVIEADQRDYYKRKYKQVFVGNEDPHWLYVASIFYHFPKAGEIVPSARWIGTVAHDGRLLWDQLSVIGYGTGIKIAPAEAEALMYPFGFALSLMNCQNVERVQVDPPAALSKKREKLRGAPLYSYHVLKIRPVVKLKTSGRRDADGEKQEIPLSMVHGHFKDFSHGNGLYGKWKGLYWWDAHTRGNPQVGVSTHDYEVLSD